MRSSSVLAAAISPTQSLLRLAAQKLLRVQRISIMNQVTLSFEEAVNTICEVARNLNHPESIRLARDSSHLDSSRG